MPRESYYIDDKPTVHAISRALGFHICKIYKNDPIVRVSLDNEDILLVEAFSHGSSRILIQYPGGKTVFQKNFPETGEETIITIIPRSSEFPDGKVERVSREFSPACGEMRLRHPLLITTREAESLREEIKIMVARIAPFFRPEIIPEVTPLEGHKDIDDGSNPQPLNVRELILAIGPLGTQPRPTPC